MHVLSSIILTLVMIPFTITLAAAHPPKVVAHRGAWYTAALPQNSIAALRQAMDIGCWGAECDVHLTADSVLVVAHDNDFGGKLIEHHTYAALATTPLPNGEPLPTLEAYLHQGLSRQSTHIVLEVKSSQDQARTARTAQLTVAMVHALGAQQRVHYIAFDYQALLAIKAADSTAHVAYLDGTKTPAQLQHDGVDGLDYHYSILQAYPQWITQARALGLSTNVWTVNTPEVMDWCITHGVDYITTDNPELLQSKLDTHVVR